jgi:hypothetical protein
MRKSTGNRYSEEFKQGAVKLVLENKGRVSLNKLLDDVRLKFPHCRPQSPLPHPEGAWAVFDSTPQIQGYYQSTQESGGLSWQ